MLRSFIKHQRPIVMFDAENQEHRFQAAEFLRTDRWGNCPMRFYLEPGYTNLVDMMENKLTAYYLSREFSIQVPDQGAKWGT